MTYPPKSLDELYQFLKQFHLSDSLYVLSCINATLKYHFEIDNKQNVPNEIKIWLGRLPWNQRFSVALTATRLARFLLLSGANDYREKHLAFGSSDFNRAMDMAGNLYDKAVERPKGEKVNVGQLLGRIGQWQFPLQANQKYTIARGYLLFIVIAAKYAHLYDINAKMREYYSIGNLEFLHCGFVFWLKTDGILEIGIETDLEGLSTILSYENQKTFYALASGSYWDYRRLVRGGDGKTVRKMNEIYGLDPFTIMPIIQAESSYTHGKGFSLVPQPKYLFDRASSGIFYLLASKEEELGKAKGIKGENPFRVAFGSIFREYVGMQLRQPNQFVQLIDMDSDFFPPPNLKIPDFALISDDRCLLLEVKTSLLKINARTYFEDAVLKEEVQNGSLKKAIEQLYKFKMAILDGTITDPRFRSVKHVYSIIVGFEDVFVLNMVLLPLLKARYGEQADQLQLACITDIETMGRFIAGNKHDVSKFMSDKIADPETATWPITNFLLEHDKETENPVLEKAFNSYMNLLDPRFNNISTHI